MEDEMVFKQELQKWAEEVVPYCNEVAKTKVNREFYAFQSEPKPAPKVLLLGLNPGLHGKDEECVKYEDEKWDIPHTNTFENFTKANPSYYQNGDKWPILEKFKKTRTVYQDLNAEFENMVYMNLLYFSSNKFDAFKLKSPKNWQDVFNICAEFTRFLIFEIIKPNRIVCLGTPCFSKLIEGNTSSTLNGVVKKATVNNIPVYGIVHPSKPGLSDVERAKIGWTLTKDWFKVEIPENIDFTTKTKINAQKVVNIFKEKGFLKEKVYEEKEKVLRFEVEGRGIKFELIITSTENGYIGIRNRYGIRNKDSKYIKITREIGLKETKHPWFGTKFFREYSADNEDELANKIHDDFTTFIKNLKQ